MSAVSIATSAPSPELARTPRPARPGTASTRRQRPRNPFPVGARFPRRSATEVHAYRRPLVTAVAEPEVFPIGASFPRRTQSEILAYLADVELVRRAPVRRSHPVGRAFSATPAMMVDRPVSGHVRAGHFVADAA